jgi:hypothetical protein
MRGRMKNNCKCFKCGGKVTSFVNTFNDYGWVCAKCKTDFFIDFFKIESNLKRVEELIEGAEPDFDNGLDIVFLKNKTEITETYKKFIEKNKKG